MSERTKAVIIEEYKALATQFGNLVFSFEVQKQEYFKKFAELTKEMETL